MYAFLLASVAGSAIGGLFDPICIAVRSIGLGVIPGAQYVAASRPRRACRRRPVRAHPGAPPTTRRTSSRARCGRLAPVLLPPDVAHRLPARRDPLHEPLHPALLVPRALSARRVPRRVRARSRSSAWRRTTRSAPTATCASCNCQGADSPAGRREVAAGRVPHVPQLRDRVPRGRDQVPLPAEPQERASSARHRAPHAPRHRGRRRARSCPSRASPTRSTSTTTRR